MKVIETEKFKRLAHTDYKTQPGFSPFDKRRGLGKDLFGPHPGNDSSDDKIVKKWKRKKRRRKPEEIPEGML